MDAKIERKINSVIKRNISLFKKPGVFTVRPGFKITGGWITDKPAIVVTVDKKLEGLDKRNMLPAEVEDIPVDVREATGMQRLRESDPESFKMAVAHGRAEHNEPIWAHERNVRTGELTKMPVNNTTKTATKKLKKPQIKYQPASLPLKQFSGKFTLTAYATPDAQYKVLHDFIAAAKSDLAIAMYDFTSGDLMNTVIDKLKPGKVNFNMVLDHPPRNKTANQTDDVTRQKILQAGGANASIKWALTRNDPAATKWIYPSAYHIKVVVQDNSAFWLSSGNFNVSNQPNLDAHQHIKGSLEIADRDWHVIVEHEGMAKMFKAYIMNDFMVAATAQSEGSAAMHAAIRQAMLELKEMQEKSSLHHVQTATRHPFTLGLKKKFTNIQATIQPLLTPDPGKHTAMYVDNVLALIKSAKKTIYMQTQYVHPSDAAEDKDLCYW